MPQSHEVAAAASQIAELHSAPTCQEDLGQVRARNFKIDPSILPDVFGRDHMARPYPESDFDFLAVNVPSTYQQGVIPDGEEAPHGLLRIIAAGRDLHVKMPLQPRISAGLLDAHRLRLQPETIIGQIEKVAAKGVVGLNPTSVNVPEAQAIARLCDARGIPYILGGIHATLDPVIAREDFPNASAIVRGTGELVIGRTVQSVLGVCNLPYLECIGPIWTMELLCELPILILTIYQW
jgi:hypothetical protein